MNKPVGGVPIFQHITFFDNTYSVLT